IVNNDYEKHVYLTRFLTLKEQEELVYMCGNKLNVYFDGGYNDSKLKRALVSIFEINNPKLKVVCTKLTSSNKFYTLRHPTVKWHFLNMGIDERMFGDIILVDNSFIVVIAEEVFDIVINDSQYINRCPITFEVVKDVIIEENNNIYKAFCSGLRLDNVVAKTFHLSRGKAKKLIENEKVTVNSVIIKKLTYEVSEKQAITIRGYGKVVIINIDVNNKSGKFILNHNRFLHKK
ncbi:MAG: YlmH/Sll1252 family protein, partial [Bacilli bacterium]